MKFELEIEDPIFQVGDLLRLPNTANDKQMHLQVLSFQADGTWHAASNKRGQAYAAVRYYETEFKAGTKDARFQILVGKLYYTLEVLADSWSNTDPPEQPWRDGELAVFSQETLRPATVHGFMRTLDVGKDVPFVPEAIGISR